MHHSISKKKTLKASRIAIKSLKVGDVQGYGVSSGSRISTTHAITAAAMSTFPHLKTLQNTEYDVGMYINK